MARTDRWQRVLGEFEDRHDIQLKTKIPSVCWGFLVPEAGLEFVKGHSIVSLFVSSSETKLEFAGFSGALGLLRSTVV